jgi:hypothetical protein
MRKTELSKLFSVREPPPTHPHPHEKFDERFWRLNKPEFEIRFAKSSDSLFG